VLVAQLNRLGLQLNLCHRLHRVRQRFGQCGYFVLLAVLLFLTGICPLDAPLRCQSMCESNLLSIFSTFPPTLRKISMTLAWSLVFSFFTFSRSVVMIPPTAVTNAAMTMPQSTSSLYACVPNVPRFSTFTVSVPKYLMAESESDFIGEQPLKGCTMRVFNVDSDAV